ncbi:MAG: ABC transporter ATP-binding protein [Candidatus Caldarchaeum sp.]|nr:ABC transporter ATP-binding protein [Candidatus Caldarchaeum sp.]
MLLRVNDLILHYESEKGVVKAVDGVSFELRARETLSIVGESGSGKSSLALALIRLTPKNVAKYAGEVFFDGDDVMRLDEESFRRKVRLNGIAMVFQGAMNTLNPVIPVVKQVAEPLVEGLGFNKAEAREKAFETLSYLGINREMASRYPHELSGGMRQRVAIAMALVTNPKIVILDEPTSALDIITQANIMNLLKKMKNDFGTSYIFITHDLALASELADKIAIMYAGKIVESGPAEKIFQSPKHPYTQLLIESVPTLRTDKIPKFIPGSPPDLINPPSGCRFHPRCPYMMKGKCDLEEPPPLLRDPDQIVSCWLMEET